jgi:hypothetical protein
MTFELLTTLIPWVVAIAVVALAGIALAVVGVTAFVRANRPVRVARHESFRSYYGRLVLPH